MEEEQKKFLNKLDQIESNMDELTEVRVRRKDYKIKGQKGVRAEENWFDDVM